MEGNVDAKTYRQSDYNSDNQYSFNNSAFLDRQQYDKAVVELGQVIQLKDFLRSGSGG